MLRRALLLLGVAGVLAACGTAAGGGAARPARGALRVLVLTQTRGFHHASIPDALAALKRLAAADHRFTIVQVAGAEELPAALRGASAVVFLLTSGELPLTSAGKQALVSFVRGGGALVGFHSATDTFHHWPAFISLIGAEFSHHPPPSTQRVVVEDRVHPATRGLGTSFSIHEEFYVFRHDPRGRVHVLARLDTGRRGPDRPLVWCRQVGRGRVFYDALGHFPQTWTDARQAALLRGGLEWALGLARGRC